MNILFTNAGRRTYLIEYALQLKDAGYDLEIFVCDVSKDTAAMHVRKDVRHFFTPRVTMGEEMYFDQLKVHCLKHEINVIIPLMDFEIPVLAKHKADLERLGIFVWVSNYETAIRCLDKKLNYDFCTVNGINVPASYFEKRNILPAIKKKIYGSGSLGLEVIKNNSWDYVFEPGVDMLQEYKEGREYGMDILNDYRGEYVHSCSREKLAMRAGETDKAVSVHPEVFEKLARRISTVFRHVGNMDVDFIVTDDKEVYFIDFNPRFGGGYPFTHASGANYLKYIIDGSKADADPDKPQFKGSITGYKGLKLYLNQNER